MHGLIQKAFKSDWTLGQYKIGPEIDPEAKKALNRWYSWAASGKKIWGKAIFTPMTKDPVLSDPYHGTPPLKLR